MEPDREPASHEVLRAVAARAEAGSQPGARDDGLRIALIVEGGGMRGVLSAGMALTLAELGLIPAFDAIYGASAKPITNLTISQNTIYDNENAWSENLTLGGNVSGFQITDNVVHDATNIGIDCTGGYSSIDINWNGVAATRNGTVSGNTRVTGLSSTSGLVVGEEVTGTGVHSNTTIASIGTGQAAGTITLSQAATAGYGTALGVIRAAVEQGKKIHVFADETRPFLQG